MSLLRTVWISQILKDFYADNAFLEKSQNWDEYVRQGIKTVVIPIEGAGSNVERNRSTLPATATPRSDSEFSYEMVDYTSDPRYITNLDEIQMSYDKMASVISQDTSVLKEKAAEDILYAWRAEVASCILRTSGSARAASAGAGTGSRKALTFQDIVKAATAMDNANIPNSGRIALLTPDMIQDLANDTDVKAIGLGTALMNFNALTPMQLAGFTIAKRSKVLRYDNSSTPVGKAPTAAAAADDNSAALFWSPFAVGRSLGNVDVFYDQQNPLYYGNVFSMEIMAGGRKASKMPQGVISIVQAASA